MKKIVALALCLVLALSLCATAFAATTTTPDVDADGYSLLNVADNSSVTMTADTFSKTVTDATVVTSGSKTTTTYFADKYVIDDVTYYECDSSIALFKLVKGSAIVYLTTADLSAGTTKVATAYIEAKDEDDWTCGDVKADCYTISGKNYVAGGANFAVYNGKFVTYGAEVATVEHSFVNALAAKSGYFTTDTKGVVVSAKCDTCKQSFTVVETVAKDYTGSVVAFNNLYVLTGSTAAAASADATAVTSAKTFDAGIAMYVGMSVMAVTGSAVVIGKKKEF